MLGLEKHGEFRSEKENVDEDILTMGRGIGKVEIDIMAPIDVNKSPKVRDHDPSLTPYLTFNSWLHELLLFRCLRALHVSRCTLRT
jgi:hypothetical protein